MNTYNIIRYKNRKLYIKELHRYTTLKEIKAFYLAGSKLTIYKLSDAGVTTDITQETIVDALTFDTESKKKVFAFMSTFLTSNRGL